MKRFRMIALAGLACGIIGAANAQESKPIGLAIRAGILFPNTSTSRDIGKTWFTGGAQLRIRDLNVSPIGTGALSNELAISVDYYGKDNASAVPVLLNYVGHANELFYTLGAGISFSKVPNLDGSSDQKTNFGYVFGVGYNFQQGRNPLFVEARYQGNQSSDLNGIGLYVGIHL